MSRIDEARRRAAGSGADNAQAMVPLAALQSEGTDAVALAQEAYPAEAPEGRRATRPGGSAPRTGSFQSSTATADAPESTLFERIDARLNEKVVIDDNMGTASREQYRRLAAVLHDAQGTTGLQVVMVASAVAGEGKTLTASNLALTFSESYQKRVLLIDADLRRPTLHSVFRLDSASGLADGLLSTTDTKMLVRQVSARLAVLPAGRPSSDPMAGLTSERMKRLLDEARQAFDWVIMDTPPVMLLPDAHLMSSMVDGAVLVVRANSTPHELVRRAAEAIGRSRILGVVLNRAEASSQQSHYQYYGYGYGGAAKNPRT
ncbi:MAG TPA: CpsD/CapB family tyrosine-protein kinase [Vicinamibacterales bacterium]